MWGYRKCPAVYRQQQQCHEAMDCSSRLSNQSPKHLFIYYYYVVMYDNLKLLVPPQVYSMYLSVTIRMCVCV